MIIDPIADMLTRIRNASSIKKKEIRLPYSNIKFAIGKILAAEGFVASAEKIDEGHGQIRMVLKYEEDGPRIRHVQRVSSPGHRVYAGYDQLPRVLSDQGIAIVSTSQGVMSNKEARKRKLGGEILCNIY